MKKILLALDKNHFVLTNTTYGLHNVFKELGGNSGNAIIQYAIQKLLTNKENLISLDFDLIHNNNKTDEYFDYINNFFDCVIFPSSSIISEFASYSILPFLTNVFEKIKIPIYALSFGASNFDCSLSLDFVLKNEKIFKRFIDSILKNNGKLALRGYFTQSVMEKLGYLESKDFKTIGCPSMFYKGCFQIDNKKVEYKNFKPLLNGYLLREKNENLFKYLNENKASVFVDQDEFFDLIYFKKLSKIKLFINYFRKKYDNNVLKLIKQKRLVGFLNIQDWEKYLLENSFNFCFGYRIHGNIFSLLNKIPSLIVPWDTRVLEMAQYFNIPFVQNLKNKKLYELYCELEYSKFNLEFSKKYEKFIQFFEDLDIATNNNFSKEVILND